MPVFIAALIGGLVSAAASMVGRALIAMGMGIVAYTGINAMMSQFATSFHSYTAALPALVLGVFGVLKIGTVFNILSSAVVARMTLDGLTSGTMKRWVTK